MSDVETLDFKALKQETEELSKQLQLRQKAVSSMKVENSTTILQLPNDVYETNKTSQTDGVFKQFHKKTLDYIQQQPTLFLNLSNTLFILMMLKEASISKNEQKTSSEPKDMNNLFTSVTMIREYVEIEEIRNLIESIDDQIDNADSAYLAMAEKYGIPYSLEKSEITKFCDELIDRINKDMDPNLLGSLQDKMYAEISKACHELAQLNITKLDIELGYLHHSDAAEIKMTPKLLEHKKEAFNALIEQGQFFIDQASQSILAPQYQQGRESRQETVLTGDHRQLS